MKSSIQNKIILLILVGIIISSLTIGSLGIVSFREELDKNVVSTMNLTCEEKAQELNNVLGRIEQSTEVMAVLATSRVLDYTELKDETFRDSYINHMCESAYEIAINTQGSIGIYLRLNPEIAGSTEGFYWLINEETGALELEENTNITQYAKDDTEHVGWYYEPVAAGHAIWMDPYENQNIERTIVSYAMPIYKDNQLIGIVGMDIDWAYITQMIDEIKLYETGYAFLMDENFTVAYSKEFSAGTNITDLNDLSDLSKDELIRNDRVFDLNYNGRQNTVAFTALTNGKIIAVIAPNEEINADFNALVGQIIVIALGSSAIFVFITMQIAKTIIRPLKQLDKAAQDLADGHLDVDLHITSNDEVGTLASSLSETARQLKIKIDYINNLAYSDKLTGIKNNTAYLQEVAYLKNDILEKKAEFAIFIIDANGLKQINDNYGHELGNELIIKVTQMVAEVFGSEHLYRIGGDEFAVICHNVSEEACEDYEKCFNDMVKHQKGRIWASASIGYAIYNSITDSTYESVFNRADEDMYENKVRMKAQGKNSQIIE